MAQIVCIAEGTYREGINNLGDIVAIHDDDVLLGDSYANFKIIQVAGVTAAELQAKLGALQPEQKMAYRTANASNVWGLERPEEKEVWNDNGVWKDLATRPKYSINLASVVADEKAWGNGPGSFGIWDAR